MRTSLCLKNRFIVMKNLFQNILVEILTSKVNMVWSPIRPRDYIDIVKMKRPLLKICLDKSWVLPETPSFLCLFVCLGFYVPLDNF